MDILQLEVFKWRGESDAEARKLAQDHFGQLAIIIDKIERDDYTEYFAYALEQVEALANQVADYVIKRMDNRARVFVKPSKDYSEFLVSIRTKKSGLLVGHHGATLDALELIISVIFNRQFALNRILTLDVDGYRERREAALIRAAKSLIREIEKDHKPRPLPNLLPKERKVIHKFLANHPYLTSVSSGKGKDRTLYIAPKSFSGALGVPSDDNDDG
ncbi:MAG: hypothetical protein HRF49_06935 [bacterium]|jgi:spoIIIJ-associated protein